MAFEPNNHEAKRIDIIWWEALVPRAMLEGALLDKWEHIADKSEDCSLVRVCTMILDQRRKNALEALKSASQ